MQRALGSIVVTFLVVSAPVTPRLHADADAHRVCAACHLGRDSGESPPPRESCDGCHLDRARERHDRTAAGKPVLCVDCHAHTRRDRLLPGTPTTEPGGEAEPVLDTMSRACVRCHEHAGRVKNARGRFVRHPVGVVVRMARGPVAGIPLPLADVAGTRDPSDDVIGCTTCHRMHANQRSYRLRWSGTDEPTACATCHEGVVSGGADPVPGEESSTG